jgi:hypothetical protein
MSRLRITHHCFNASIEVREDDTESALPDDIVRIMATAYLEMCWEVYGWTTFHFTGRMEGRRLMITDSEQEIFGGEYEHGHYFSLGLPEGPRQDCYKYYFKIRPIADGCTSVMIKRPSSTRTSACPKPEFMPLLMVDDNGYYLAH